LPVLELLSQYFEISRDDDDRKRRERVLGKVLGLDRTLEDTLPYLYSLQAIADTGDSLPQMDPQIRRRRTLDAIKRILLRESLNQPLMVIFEDLHWIDSETQALLNLVVDAIANARILLLVNYRPEYRHEWGSRTHYTQLRLDPLATESAEEMLSALLGDEKDLIPLKRLIVERTQGTPFFMEVMVQALFEEGVLQRNGTVKTAQPISAIKVPATVQALLASRIDRLSAPEKELLQTLAVLWREFSVSLAQHVTLKSVDDLEQMLSRLQFGEFIYEQPAICGVEYSFKHALTQEVAYNSILAERRRALHERAARAIEGLYAQQLDDHYSDLGHHYLRSDDAAKAIRYAQLAAEQAVSRGAYSEATSLIDAAPKLLRKLPERDARRAEFALRSLQDVIALVLHGGASLERERAVRRMCELGEKIGEMDQLLHGLPALSHIYFTRDEPIHGLELAKRCVQLAEVTQEPWLLADAHSRYAIVASSSGKLREAVSHFEDVRLYSSRTDRRFTSAGFLYPSAIASVQAPALHLLGRVNEALKLAESGLRHARDSGHLFSLGLMLSAALARLRRYRHEPQSVPLLAEEGVALSEENGFRDCLHWGRFNRGWALAELGQPERGIAEMEAGLAGFRSVGGALGQQYEIAVLAQNYATVGRTEEAYGMLNKALAHIERTGATLYQPEMQRLKGEMLLILDRRVTDQAEACFRTGLDIAHEQDAKWWELRTTASLARLLRDTNRRDEARTMLAEIYDWFTEGFDLPDLKEAKALLEELGGQES
jgi:hypothetical protein